VGLTVHKSAKRKDHGRAAVGGETQVLSTESRQLKIGSSITRFHQFLSTFLRASSM